MGRLSRRLRAVESAPCLAEPPPRWHARVNRALVDDQVRAAAERLNPKLDGVPLREQAALLLGELNPLAQALDAAVESWERETGAAAIPGPGGLSLARLAADVDYAVRVQLGGGA